MFYPTTNIVCTISMLVNLLDLAGILGYHISLFHYEKFLLKRSIDFTFDRFKTIVLVYFCGALKLLISGHVK